MSILDDLAIHLHLERMLCRTDIDLAFCLIENLGLETWDFSDSPNRPLGLQPCPQTIDGLGPRRRGL